jgi:hypothetical protein
MHQHMPGIRVALGSDLGFIRRHDRLRSALQKVRSIHLGFAADCLQPHVQGLPWPIQKYRFQLESAQ